MRPFRTIIFAALAYLVAFVSLAAADTPVAFTLRNLDPAAAKNAGEIYFDRPELNTLVMTLVNNTGKDLALVGMDSGVDGTAVDLTFPSEIFSQADIARIQASDSKGDWSASLVSGSRGKYLRLTPKDDGAFPNGAKLSFTLTKLVSSNKQQALGQVKAKFTNVTGLAGVEVFETLTLEAYPSGELKELSADLDVSVESPLVFITKSLSDPQRTRLVLNVKNKKKNAPLIEKPARSGASPVLNVSFVYGSGAGALTEDIKLDREHPASTLQAARNIKVGLAQIYVDKWNVTAPREEESLVWKIAPVREKNPQALGFGDAANLDVEISDIVTKLAPGHTQMYVQYANFPGYRDGFFTLDLQKVYRTPQIVGFQASPQTVALGGSIQLDWTGVAVDALVLEYADENNAIQKLTSKAGQIPLDTSKLPAAAKFKTSPRMDTVYRLSAYDAQGELLPDASRTLSVFVQWPTNPTLQRAWISPDPVPMRADDGMTSATVNWEGANVTPWHKIVVFPGHKTVTGDTTSTTVSLSPSDMAYRVELYDRKNPQPLSIQGGSARSLKDILVSWLKDMTYRASRYRSFDDCGLAEGGGQVTFNTSLSFSSELVKERDPLMETRAVYQTAATYFVTYQNGYTNTGSPAFARLSGPVQANGYDLTVAVREVPGQTLRFRFDPGSMSIVPVGVDAAFTPAVSGQVGNSLSNELKSVAQRTRTTLNVTCAANGASGTLSALKSAVMQR